MTRYVGHNNRYEVLSVEDICSDNNSQCDPSIIVDSKGVSHCHASNAVIVKTKRKTMN